MYNPFWNKTITLFTPLEINNNLKWYKYTLQNCFAKCRNSYIDDINSKISKNNIIIRLPYNNYETYINWKNLNEYNLKTKYSVSQDSILIIDTIKDTIPDNTSGNSLFDKYNCYKPISIIENKYICSPHIYIIGD